MEQQLQILQLQEELNIERQRLLRTQIVLLERDLEGIQRQKASLQSSVDISSDNPS